VGGGDLEPVHGGQIERFDRLVPERGESGEGGGWVGGQMVSEGVELHGIRPHGDER
jgi:hypothetical protein